jgi:hypothetical protein
LDNNPSISAHTINPWDYPAVSHELMTQQWCELHRLIEGLSAVQSRLGTPLEQANDYDRVRDLGHKIRNKLHLMQLWTELGLIRRDEILLGMTAI